MQQHEPISYMEQLENLHVLIETRQMLETKLAEIQEEEEKQLMKEDIRKINQDIASITGNTNQEIEETAMLFNPGVYQDE